MFFSDTQLVCNSCHQLVFWMAGLELCLCKHNLPPCIHSLSPERLLQERKSYLEGLLAMQQPEALSKAGLPAVPRSTNSEALIQRRTWLKQARWHRKWYSPFTYAEPKLSFPTPTVYILCKGVFKQESTDQQQAFVLVGAGNNWWLYRFHWGTRVWTPGVTQPSSRGNKILQRSVCYLDQILQFFMIYVHSFLTTVTENSWNAPSTQEFECIFPFNLCLLLLIFAFSEYLIHFIPVISACKGALPISTGCGATVCYVPHLMISSV